MTRTTILTATLLTSGLLLSGCSSTPRAKQVRNEANERFNLIQAQMTYDQAGQSYETGQFDKAMNLVNQAIARAPQQSDFHLLQGRIYLETHRLEPAFESFDKAIELDETNHKAHYFRGIVLQRWSKFEEARDAYRAAFENHTEGVQYLTAAAEMMVTLGEFEDAKALIEPRMAYFEHNAALHQLLGQIAHLQHEYPTAIEHFTEARMLNPEDVSVLEDLATSHFTAGNYEQAYHTVKELQEHGSEGRHDLTHMEARCLTMIDRVNEARNIYLKLSQETPANVDVWIELGNVAFEVGDFRRVSLAASRAIALEPERFEGHLLMGVYEQHRGNSQQAIGHLKRASDLAPEVAWPHLLLGMLLEETGESSKALAAYAAALRAEPQNVEARRLFQIASEVDSDIP